MTVRGVTVAYCGSRMAVSGDSVLSSSRACPSACEGTISGARHSEGGHLGSICGKDVLLDPGDDITLGWHHNSCRKKQEAAGG